MFIRDFLLLVPLPFVSTLSPLFFYSNHKLILKLLISLWEVQLLKINNIDKFLYESCQLTSCTNIDLQSCLIECFSNNFIWLVVRIQVLLDLRFWLHFYLKISIRKIVLTFDSFRKIVLTTASILPRYPSIGIVIMIHRNSAGAINNYVNNIKVGEQIYKVIINNQFKVIY